MQDRDGAPARIRRRAVGRPRGFSDEDVFRATTRLLLAGGLANTTLKHVAGEIGFSHQAVAQRFETKEGLLRAYFDWMQDVISEEAAEIRERPVTTAMKLRQLLTLPINPRLFDVDTFEKQASWTLLSLELRRDPAIAPLIAAGTTAYVHVLADLVREGQERGELGAADPYEIAEMALVAGTGSAMQWLLNQKEPLLEKMERCIDLALRPYLTPGA
jgi:AcrR family transcriptional regulator